MNFEYLGPFASLAALLYAAAQAVKFIATNIGGEGVSWRPPDQNLPGKLLSTAVLAGIISLLACTVLITPANAKILIYVTLVLAVLTPVLFLKYQKLHGIHMRRWSIRVVDEQGEARKLQDVVIGSSLTKEAIEAKKLHGIKSDEALLDGTNPPGEITQLFAVEDIESARLKLSTLLLAILALFIITPILGGTAFLVSKTNKEIKFDADSLEKVK